jgi:alanine dehydrogenase
MAKETHQSISSLITSAGLMPQEAMVEVKKREKKLYIGIPKETSFQENRIPLVPESVSLLVSNGHEIVIEAGAGKTSNIEDSDFSANSLQYSGGLQSRYYSKSGSTIRR